MTNSEQLQANNERINAATELLKTKAAGSGSSVEVYDGLDSDSTTAALSANQGKILNETVANLQNQINSGIETIQGQVLKSKIVPISELNTMIQSNPAIIDKIVLNFLEDVTSWFDSTTFNDIDGTFTNEVLQDQKMFTAGDMLILRPSSKIVGSYGIMLYGLIGNAYNALGEFNLFGNFVGSQINLRANHAQSFSNKTKLLSVYRTIVLKDPQVSVTVYYY